MALWWISCSASTLGPMPRMPRTTLLCTLLPGQLLPPSSPSLSGCCPRSAGSSTLLGLMFRSFNGVKFSCVICHTACLAAGAQVIGSCCILLMFNTSSGANKQPTGAPVVSFCCMPQCTCFGAGARAGRHCHTCSAPGQQPVCRTSWASPLLQKLWCRGEPQMQSC